MLGANSSYQASGAATPEQATQQYGQVQNAQAQQQAFLQALAAQGGVQNQQDVFQQQQQLAQQLQQQTLGQGPNPAQAQLTQNTSDNVQRQAALMAGQRGASANAGLTARSAANQGANIQQQATGQAATMQANQQLSAQQQLQQQQAQMAALSGQQVGQQQQGLQQAGNLALQGQSNVISGITGQNQINAQTAAGNAANNGAIAGGLIGAAGAAMIPKKAHGGPIPGKAKVAGDSEKNDTVHAMLSPGEIVIPRSVVIRGPDAVRAFAAHIMEQEDSE